MTVTVQSGRPDTRLSDPVAPGHDALRRGHSKRLDIQGLRALAVIPVVINHMSGHPVGGFVGVDVFFVISGYLITSLLVREFDKTGRISITGFYRRRARRLFPAAFLTTLLTIIVANHIFPSARFHRTWVDGLWASAFWANWHFISSGTNYFTATLPPSPFQHYWSLSVEEQFYVVWPMLLFVAGLIAVGITRGLGTHPRHARAIGGAVAVAVLSAASLYWASNQTDSASVSAYFSTLTRAWELGLGALLAFLVPYIRARGIWLTLVSALGTVMILVSIFTTTSTHFPFPGALLPCVGAALVIGATGAAWNPLLANRPAVFIGDISYSIYLVHFPIIMLVDADMNGHSVYYYGICTLLTLGLAMAMYAGVERPILESNWLLGRGNRRTPEYSDAVQWLCAAGCLVVLAFAVAVEWPGTAAADLQNYAKIVAQNSTVPTTTIPGAPAAGPKQKELTDEITAALTASSYPANLSPTMSAEISQATATRQVTRCAVITLQPAANCTWGDPKAKHTLYLVGDSTSMVYAQAVAAIVEHTPGWKLRFAGAFGCRFLSVVFTNTDTKVQNGCQAHNDAVLADIRSVKPDVIMVTNLNERGPLLSTHRAVPQSEGVGYLTAELNKVKGSYKKAVIVANPPPSKMPDCYKPGSAPVSCVSQVSGVWLSDKQFLSAAVAKIGATYIDPRPWFCSAAGYCPPFVGTTPSFHELNHASTDYMAKIWPVMQEAFTTDKVFTVPAA